MLVLFQIEAIAASYYVSSSTGNDNNPGTRTKPWYSLKKLNNSSFEKGDSILLKRNDYWDGHWVIDDNGTKSAPLVVSSYGQGELPMLSNSIWDYNTDGCVIRIKGEHIIIQNLHFINGVPHPYEDDKNKHTNVYDMGAVNLTKESANCIVQYCEIENYPIGIQSQGLYNRIFQNYIHDCNIAMCPPWWGPIAIFVGGAYNEISHNYIVNYIYQDSSRVDGGAIEIDRFCWDGLGYGADNISIHHNISLASCGVLEVEPDGNSKGGYNNLSFINNYSFDHRHMIDFEWTHNVEICNNVFIRNKRNSFTQCIRVEGSDYKFETNIFIIAGNRKIYSVENENAISSHKHNVYFSEDGIQTNPTGDILIDSTELVLNDRSQLVPYFYSEDGILQKPKPDEQGIVKATIPVEKLKFESIEITIPK
jgi:hypothetical protein